MGRRHLSQIACRAALAALATWYGLPITCDGVNEAAANILQSASAKQTDPLSGDFLQPVSVDSAGDVGGNGIVSRDVLAEIPAAGVDPTMFSGFASASVGRFGAIGLSATDFSGTRADTSADTSADVLIINSHVYVNTTPFSQHLSQHLIIDGGSMSVAGTRNASIEFIYDDATVTSFSDQFDYLFDATLATDALGRASFTVNRGSTFDLGVVFDPVAEVATIPLQALTLDLGSLLPGDDLEIDFHSTFHLVHHPNGAGTLTAHYSDPFHLSANPALGTVAPETVALPEPGTLSLFASGTFALLGFATYRRRNPTVKCELPTIHEGPIAGFGLRSSVAA